MVCRSKGCGRKSGRKKVPYQVKHQRRSVPQRDKIPHELVDEVYSHYEKCLDVVYDSIMSRTKMFDNVMEKLNSKIQELADDECADPSIVSDIILLNQTTQIANLEQLDLVLHPKEDKVTSGMIK